MQRRGRSGCFLPRGRFPAAGGFLVPGQFRVDLRLSLANLFQPIQRPPLGGRQNDRVSFRLLHRLRLFRHGLGGRIGRRRAEGGTVLRGLGLLAALAPKRLRIGGHDDLVIHFRLLGLLHLLPRLRAHRRVIGLAIGGVHQRISRRHGLLSRHLRLLIHLLGLLLLGLIVQPFRLLGLAPPQKRGIVQAVLLLGGLLLRLPLLLGVLLLRLLDFSFLLPFAVLFLDGLDHLQEVEMGHQQHTGDADHPQHRHAKGLAQKRPGGPRQQHPQCAAEHAAAGGNSVSEADQVPVAVRLCQRGAVLGLIVLHAIVHQPLRADGAEQVENAQHRQK